jgi:uncharacterized lipoprotein YmbA
MTRALAASLAARLPHAMVTATPPIERPARQILVDVGAFEATADHKVVLAVRWTVLDGASRRVLLTEEASLVEPIAGTGDGALVAAMSQAIEVLAGQLAAEIDGDRRAEVRISRGQNPQGHRLSKRMPIRTAAGLSMARSLV